MFYDTRTLFWNNFEFLRCTHQAHSGNFWERIFCVHFWKSIDNIGWPIFCAWWVQIKNKMRLPGSKYTSPAKSILTRRKPLPAAICTTVDVNGVQKRPQKKISYPSYRWSKTLGPNIRSIHNRCPPLPFCQFEKKRNTPPLLLFFMSWPFFFKNCNQGISQ